jgi:uncharacterized protein
MNRIIRTNLFDVTGLLLLAAAFLLLTLKLDGGNLLPSSFLNLNTIFISILIEAFPFVLIGVLIAGVIQIFVTEEHIQRWIPRNRTKAIIMSCVIGALFPACECGIVPIVRRLVSKGVPLYAAIGFMLTGPLINPIVIASTYLAFGNNAAIAGWRMGLGFAVALIVAFAVSFFFRGHQLKEALTTMHHTAVTKKREPFSKRFFSMLTHSIDEFFDMAKFLILGAFLAAAVQTYMPAKSLLEAGDGPFSSIFVMMGLAYVLSLCSEADAFIGSSFNSIFPTPSVLAFLIFGPMIDLKNTLMMLSVFRAKFVFSVLFFVATTVFLSIVLVQNFL